MGASLARNVVFDVMAWAIIYRISSSLSNGMRMDAQAAHWFAWLNGMLTALHCTALCIYVRYRNCLLFDRVMAQNVKEHVLCDSSNFTYTYLLWFLKFYFIFFLHCWTSYTAFFWTGSMILWHRSALVLRLLECGGKGILQ